MPHLSLQCKIINRQMNIQYNVIFFYIILMQIHFALLKKMAIENIN